MKQLVGYEKINKKFVFIGVLFLIVSFLIEGGFLIFGRVVDMSPLIIIGITFFVIGFVDYYFKDEGVMRK